MRQNKAPSVKPIASSLPQTRIQDFRPDSIPNFTSDLTELQKISWQPKDRRTNLTAEWKCTFPTDKAFPRDAGSLSKTVADSKTKAASSITRKIFPFDTCRKSLQLSLKRLKTSVTSEQNKPRKMPVSRPSDFYDFLIRHKRGKSLFQTTTSAAIALVQMDFQMPPAGPTLNLTTTLSNSVLHRVTLTSNRNTNTRSSSQPERGNWCNVY